MFNAEGKEIGYDELIEALAQPDVVFIGEIHNCCITHWLEYEITRSLYAIHKEKLMLGAEMLEADNQLILDEYMSRAISYDRFEAEARLWDNYSTDYAPFVLSLIHILSFLRELKRFVGIRHCIYFRHTSERRS